MTMHEIGPPGGAAHLLHRTEITADAATLRDHQNFGLDQRRIQRFDLFLDENAEIREVGAGVCVSDLQYSDHLSCRPGRFPLRSFLPPIPRATRTGTGTRLNTGCCRPSP